ncbi:MAG: hypothetical protein ABL959_00335 [Pyrinomonadaceae bacterium]
MKYILLCLLFVVMAVVAMAQNTFRVGDRVAVAATSQEGVIESLTDRGDGAKVKFGPGKYEFQYVLFKDLISPEAAALERSSQQDEIKQKPIRAQFEGEARPFAITVKTLGHAYDPRFRQEAGGISDKPATYEKWMRDLESLNTICQKYPNLTNRPGADAENISQNLGDWCKLADQRTAVVSRMKMMVGGIQAGNEIGRWKLHLDTALRNPTGRVNDDVQTLLYDRAAWEQKELQTAGKKFTDVGETMPPSVMAPLNAKVNELKARIDTEAPTRNWTEPPYSDAALEAMVKKAYPGQFPGVKVLKTGMTYTTWKAFDDTSLVRQGTDYKVYRIEQDKNRYKNGRALVKIPNQPFCQMRDFSIQQTRTGASYSAAKIFNLGTSGIFVKCP